jgi:hypothetical protein
LTPGLLLAYQDQTTIDSPPGGNSNGRFDPGEDAQLVISLRNVGDRMGQNVTARLRSGSSLFTVTDSLGTYGDIPSGTTRTNGADRFAAFASQEIQPGTVVPLTLQISADGGYSATQQIAVRVGPKTPPGRVLADHDTGYCKLTVSAFGAIGFECSGIGGSGFCYPKTAPSGLRYCSMLCGNSPGYVVDHYYGVPYSTFQTDWVVSDSLRFYPPVQGDELIRGACTDAGHPIPQGLKTTQTSYQSALPGYDDFVIISFDYENTGAAPLSGLYSGIMCDFNIGVAAFNDARTVPARRAVFMRQNTTPNPTLGIKLLDPPVAANLSVIDNTVYAYPDSAMNEGMKHRFLNGALHFASSDRTYDWAVMLSAGPFDLAPGGHQVVAYAMVGGADTAEFLVNCDSAQSFYDRRTGFFARPAPRPLDGIEFGLTPSLIAQSTRMSYQLPRPGRVTVKAYDILGREKATILDEPMNAGSGTVTWVPQSLTRGVYFVRADILGSSIAEKVMIVGER